MQSTLEQAQEAEGVDYLRLIDRADNIEVALSWHGANPKEIPIADLREHIRKPLREDGIEDKYRARIRNRATAIRAYCVQCQGGFVAGVAVCPSITCPLHPFRQGGDPLRGFDLPPVAELVLDDEDEEDDTEFEDGSVGNEADAKD